MRARQGKICKPWVLLVEFIKNEQNLLRRLARREQEFATFDEVQEGRGIDQMDPSRLVPCLPVDESPQFWTLHH